ncbi:hypothetical protein TTHERM_00420850 (macronuclear) [Tetrahymena thermophila SB210]|uniref:LisH domain-containing protein ARMC9 n=1 Tax=Tetrahymena thermophila (strain SB210) TaxID=312017 RepID=I7MH16_TETTS|nr:hypothetical protein TTHERM_00420850 [Tetrahymena thermophila SB210]EAR85677.1 hypothetical protein TTHERM_00420850 [Tetrahymena thermophila SB210]|eukprot:XP_001033340.1 hypothetical protein TTHERM_00420850 [Tetrahymena thermophila SB210]
MKKNQGSAGNGNQNSNLNSNSQSQNNTSKGRLSAQNQRKVAQSNTNISHQNSSASTNNNSHQSIQNQEEKRRPQTNADKYKPNQISNVNNLQRQSVQSVTNLREKKQLEMHADQDIYYGDNDDNEDKIAKDSQPETERQIELSEDQESIVKLVSGYLVKHGCNRSNEIFLKEIYRPQNPQNKKQMIVNQLINAFQKGKRDLFFGKWTSFPHNNKPNQIDKLEFYLQIYFLIYEIHPLFKTKDKIGNDRIEYFRSYLDSKGSELSKTTELLTFYALPYIQKPYEHQSFKHLFTQEWVQDLQKKLKSSLDKLINEEDQYCKLEELYFQSKSKPDQAKQQQAHQQILSNQNVVQQQPFYPAPYAPALQQQMNNNGQNINISNNNMQPNNINVSYLQNDISYLPDNSYITDNNSLRANNDQYLRVLQELNSRYSNLHKVYIQVQEQAKQAIMDSHQKWFKLGQDLVYLAKDLIGMVEMATKGNPPSPQIFESKKKKLGQFEHFLSSNIEDLVQQNQDISLFEKQVSIIEYDQSPIMQQYKVQQHPQFNGQILNSNLQFDQSPQNIQQVGAGYDINLLNSRKGQNSYDQMSQVQQQQQQQQIHQQHQQYQIPHQNQQALQQNHNLYQQHQIDQDNDFQSYAPIDFNKIKISLKQETNFQFKISILQALRWRIAKTRNAYQRREVIISYTINDLLGCSKNDQLLQNSIFNSPNERLTEFGLRLVNALASDFEGRTYLVESEALVKLLIAILRREKEDSSTRRNALGALQKLSLRKKPQIVMIQNDLIKWIVETLREEKDQLSEYSYEYATALFMNLSLRSLGRDKCEDEDLRVLEVLQQLLEHENQQVRTFVNGTLYSLLSRPALKEQSRQLSLLQYLVHLRDNSDERFNKQLQYIINQLEKPDEEEEEENTSDQEEDNDEDDIEDEEMDDEDDQDEYLDLIEVPGNDQQLIGENLLIQQFSLRGQEALRQHNMTRTALEESKKNAHNQSILNQSRINNRPEPFNRPATPSLSISQISHSQMQGYQQDTKRNKNQHNIQHQNSQQKQYQQNIYTQQQYQQRDNGEQLSQQQQQLMLLKQKQQMQQQQIQQNQQQQQYINQYQQHQKQNLNQQYIHQSPQMYNDGNNYSQNSSDSKTYIQHQQQHQQSVKNNHNLPVNQNTKLPHNEIKVSDTKEAFAPRPKIPRTPPSNIDEDSN